MRKNSKRIMVWILILPMVLLGCSHKYAEQDANKFEEKFNQSGFKEYYIAPRIFSFGFKYMNEQDKEISIVFFERVIKEDVYEDALRIEANTQVNDVKNRVVAVYNGKGELEYSGYMNEKLEPLCAYDGIVKNPWGMPACDESYKEPIQDIEKEWENKLKEINLSNEDFFEYLKWYQIHATERDRKDGTELSH